MPEAKGEPLPEVATTFPLRFWAQVQENDAALVTEAAGGPTGFSAPSA